MKLAERAKVVRAMETIVRCVNNEDYIEAWFMCGVADGDITENTNDTDLEYYCERENFAELMGLFLRIMNRARKDGGLYCDKVVSKEET